MSLTLHQPGDRWSEGDRLFLVYYSLPLGFNKNNWAVSPTSIDRNIQSAINKPVVVYRKNASNPFHTNQVGNYVHPTLAEATASLGHPPKMKDYLQWQERFSVGRVRGVEKRDKGYAFTLEITDPEVKNILKSDQYVKGIPGWTSPQILFPAGKYPTEEQTSFHEHWMISHLALVDIPAYGFDKSSMAAKCIGEEQECMIQTKSASQEDLGFCIKQATLDLMQSVSSHLTSNSNSSHTIMSTNETQSTPTQGETVVTKTMSPTTDNSNSNTTPQILTNSGQPSQPLGEEGKALSPSSSDENQTEESKEVKVSSIEEANATIGQMSSLIKDLQKTVKMQGKELDRINIERKQARLSYIIPRDLFKSDKSHQEAVQSAMNETVSESFLIDYWKTKRELVMMQSSPQPRMTTMEQPIAAKQASSTTHDVPDYGSSTKTTQRSNVEKQLELQRMIIEGGS